MWPAERETPLTDKVLNTFDGNTAKLAANLATHAENLERQLADAIKKSKESERSYEVAAQDCERWRELSVMHARQRDAMADALEKIATGTHSFHDCLDIARAAIASIKKGDTNE